MTQFFDLLREAINTEPHRASERSVRRPPWQPESVSRDVIHAFIRGPFEDGAALWTEKSLPEEADISVKLLAPMERVKDLCGKGDARALLKLSTKRKFEESTKNKLAKCRGVLLAMSQQYEPGPVNLPLPTLETIIKAEIAQHLDLSPNRMDNEEIDLEPMLEFLLQSYEPIHLPNIPDAREIRAQSDTLTRQAFAVKSKVPIAEQDIAPYLLGLEMPAADFEQDGAPRHYIPNLGHAYMPRLNNLRGRTKATEYLPWHLFGRRRAFWSHSLVGKPSSLFLEKVEQSIRRSTFHKKDMLGRPMTLRATLFKLVEIVPAWYPPIPVSQNISSDELRVELIRDMNRRRRQGAGEEDVEAMFLENVWAQNRGFNKKLDQQRNRMREIMSHRRHRARERVSMVDRSETANATGPSASAFTCIPRMGESAKGKGRAIYPSCDLESDYPAKRHAN